MATAATIAAAAAMTKGIGLRLETDQNDGHGRQSQHQLNNIALHQITSETRGQKWNDKFVSTIARVAEQLSRRC